MLASREGKQRLLYDHDSPLPQNDQSDNNQEASVNGRRLLVGKTSHEKRAFFRILALLCTCTLGVGSHYTQYVLGPLKSRFLRGGTSNTEFSLLISAFSLNSTWTPLVSVLMVTRLGTTFTSILVTSVIFLGTILLLLGDISEDVRLMALGMFVFGLGVSPLSVVQETIIVRFFQSRDLGFSMALGLLVGKCASFLSARTSYPLTHHFGSRAPFYLATFLAALSVVVNLVYITASKWLVDGAETELESSDINQEVRHSSDCFTEAQTLERAVARHQVHFGEIAWFGDMFWAYVGISALSGMLWLPFTHLASNIIEQRYGMTENDANQQASYLLAGSLLLYPICGYLVDRHKKHPIIMQLFLLSSFLTLCCYAWLALPPQWTQTALPAVVAFGSGIGFAPLVVVLLAPHIVPMKYIATALGVHKSLEQTGTTIFQTIAGLSLDTQTSHSKPTADSAPCNNMNIQYLLNTFVFLNLLQFLAILGMARLDSRRKTLDARASKFLGGSAPMLESNPEAQALISDAPNDRYPCYSAASPGSSSTNEATKGGQVNREILIWMCGGFIFFTWMLFLTTAWLRLRSKDGN